MITFLYKFYPNATICIKIFCLEVGRFYSCLEILWRIQWVFLRIKIKQNSSQLYFETKKYTQDSPWIIHFSSFKRDRLVCLKIFFLFFGQIKITVVIKDFDLGVNLYIIQVLARKIAHKVELCPKNTKEWQIASRRLNCTNDISNTKNRYHCLPANDLSTLVEFCYDETRLGVVKGI